MASSTNQADEIQGRMRQVRYEMGDDVQGLVENARLMTDWQYYVRTSPWLCLGVAAAIGYLVVPQKVQIVKPDPAAMVELAKARQIRVNAEIQPKPTSGLMDRLMNIAAGMILQGGLALVSGQLNHYLDRALRGGKAAQGDGRQGGHEESHH